MSRSRFAVLNADLNEVIRKMKKLQRKIAADSQPLSMTELGKLTKLGKKYAKIVKKLSKLEEESAG